MEEGLQIKSLKIENPGGLNMILGQAHFIKTVEDLHETLVASVPGIKFGLAFVEASGPCLVRTSGNEESLQTLAGENALRLAAGHAFIIFIEEAFPVNVLNAVKAVPEVCNIYCATANPVEVVLAESNQGRGILGVIDGLKTEGLEGDEDIKDRKELLRTFGYKLKS